MILCIGIERSALRQRHRALHQAGFGVEAVHLSEAVQALQRCAYEAIVIGGRVPDDEARLLSARFRQRCPGGKVVVLHEGSRRSVDFADAVIAHEDSAENLVDTVHALGVAPDESMGARTTG